MAVCLFVCLFWPSMPWKEKQKPAIPCGTTGLLELLGRFELPTSSLPIPYTSVLLFISYCKLSYVIRCIRCSSKCFLISLLFPFVISWVLLCTSLRCRCVFWCVFPDGVPENLGCTAAAFLIGVGVHPQRDGGVAVAQGLTHRGHIRPGGDGY